MSRWRALIIVSVVLYAGCDSMVPARDERDDRAFALREVARYGAAELSDQDHLRESERRAGGELLAGIAGLAVDASGHRFILDQAWSKIGVFDREGHLHDVILGGSGDGPGEFRQAVHLTELPSGGLSVLDFANGRATWFVDDEVAAVIPTGISNSLRHLVTGDTIWVTRSGGLRTPTASAYLFNHAGELIDTLPPLNAQDEPYGAPISIGTDASGTVLLSTARPGVWMEVKEGEMVRRGEVRFPEFGPPVTEQVGENEFRVTPAQVSASGIGVMGDSLVLQGYLMLDRPFDWEDDSRPDVHRYLSIHDRYGTHLYDVPLAPGMDTRYLYIDPFDGHVFVTTFEPWPQVVEYELIACTDCQ